MTSRRLLLSVALALVLGAAGCNLAGDVTPPPGVAVGTPAAPAGQATQSPASAPPPTAPDPAQADTLYAERCAPCHGTSGQGDGAQGADLPIAPAKLADSALARPASPAAWYGVVTDGRMARFMPPFNSLTDQQRWDLVAYALEFSADPASVQMGSDLYEANCSACHGQDGTGADGPSLVEPAFYASRSRLDLHDAIRDGAGEAMPAFGDQLGDEQLWSIAAYVQQLAFGSTSSSAASSGDSGGEAAAPLGAEISGVVVDGASGEAVPAGQTVTLHGFDGQDEVVTQDTEVDPQGRYSFEGVELASGRLFLASTEFDGIRYTSDVAHVADPNEPLDLPITVFGSTTEPAGVRAPRLHILIDQAADGGYRVVELWVLVNAGDKTVVSADGTGGVEIALPPQASNVQFEDPSLAEGYQPTNDTFSLVTPLRPGGDSAQVVFSFDLPAADGAEITQSMTVPVDAITALVVAGGPRISGNDVTDQGMLEAAGEQLHQYDLGPLSAGDTVALQLSPPPFWANLLPAASLTSWLAGLAALLVAAAAVVWWYRPWLVRGEAGDRTPVVGSDRAGGERSQLLLELAALDDAFDRGEVEEAEYQSRRTQLKADLLRRMRQEDD